MRDTSQKGLTPVFALLLLSFMTALASLTLPQWAAADGLRGDATIDDEATPPLISRPVNNDERQVRNYPEQPPVIPHSIRGYQVDLRFNQCLTCHSRTAAPQAGAPMVGVTHFMDREGQVLSEVSPRRYFCTQCHVPQTAAQPPIDNTFFESQH